MLINPSCRKWLPDHGWNESLGNFVVVLGGEYVRGSARGDHFRLTSILGL